MSDALADVLLADSVTTLDARHAEAVVVTGSHGGAIAARYAASARVRAVVFNDAGVGRDAAGIAGLALLDTVGIAAFAVSHVSARIARSRDSLEHGIVSHANRTARSLAVASGMRCAEAVERLRRAPRAHGTLAPGCDTRRTLVPASGDRAPIVALDSIGLVEERDRGAILVIGSHGALHGGDPASALPVDAAAAFFHDAGGGKDGAGFTRLPVLAARGIAAATVDFRSARIGDALSMWQTGVLSRVNDPARARWRDGMTVQGAATALTS
jgi:hypothetical protein